MRTATPFATCVVTTARSSSATSGAISTPSFIGPGCMTSASGRAQSSVSSVSPYRIEYSRSEGRSPDAMRSCWSRRAMTVCAPLSAARRSLVTVSRRSAGIAAAHASNPRRSVAGPQIQTSAPAVVRLQMFDRATREWRMSPRMTIFFPATFFPGSRSRSVYRSRSAWVGCACQPSPPLMTWPVKTCAARYGAPLRPWRMTSMSAPRASTVRTVSTSDSPFATELVAAAMFTTSAERFFAATSNETRVRVEAS